MEVVTKFMVTKSRFHCIHVATIHEGKKTFICDICNAKFRLMGELNVHVSTVHEGKKQFQCEICDANFGQKSNFNEHIAKAHEGKKKEIRLC